MGHPLPLPGKKPGPNRTHSMTSNVRRAPLLLWVLIGLLTEFWTILFALEPTPRKLLGMLINLALFYFIVCGNRWVTYIAAAFLATIAVEGFFIFPDNPTDVLVLINGILCAATCMYFFSRPMDRFFRRQ